MDQVERFRSYSLRKSCKIYCAYSTLISLTVVSNDLEGYANILSDTLLGFGAILEDVGHLAPTGAVHVAFLEDFCNYGGKADSFARAPAENRQLSMTRCPTQKSTR